MSSAAVDLNDYRRRAMKADIDKGYDRLAHGITDALILNKARLSGVEIQVLFAIIAKTYRFQKREDWITNSQIMKMTALGKGHISNTLKSLKDKNVVYKNGHYTGINQYVEEWKVHESVNSKSSQICDPEFTNLCTGVHEFVNESTQICETHKKETFTKETFTKESDVDLKNKAPEKPKPKTKTKPKNTIPNIELPDYVNRELFETYLNLRVQKKYTMSDQAMKILVGRIKTHNAKGQDVNFLIESAILGGWKSIYPDSNTKQSTPNTAPSRSNTSRKMEVI